MASLKEHLLYATQELTHASQLDFEPKMCHVLLLSYQLELAVEYVGVGFHCYLLPKLQSKIYSAFSISMTN